MHGGVKGCLVTLVGSAPSSPLSAGFMWVDLQLEASSETAGMNVIQWQQSSTQRKVCLCGAGRMHASPAFLLFFHPPQTATAPHRTAPHRPVRLSTDRALGNAEGHGCSSAPLSGEHCWSGGLRYCWLMSLILPASFLNALLLPSPLLPLPALPFSLSLSLSLYHTPEPSPSPLPLLNT